MNRVRQRIPYIFMASFFSTIFLFAFIGSTAQKVGYGIPHLLKRGNYAQLIVDNKPFIITGGELGNSTASSARFMDSIWPKLKKLNLNTVIAPVYWELTEPVEGEFDFQLVDDLISNSRKNNFKLVLLWFGTWKNSMSCYVPEWMKMDQQRFPRTQNSTGKTEEIITPFSLNALQSDKKAFIQLMRHLKEIDSKQQTVVMIQVENEIGMLPEARDYSSAANDAFNKPVPAALINYLESNKNSLLPEIKQVWGSKGFKTSGSWEDVFGKSLATDELFMAWYFGAFVEEIAKAGKNVYDLPMYVNAALNRAGRKPGEYPSAGPLPHVMDVWKAAAPSLDFFSPDFYNPDFKYWNDLYTRSSNPLFIPEHKFEPGVDAKALYAIGHYKAIGFSPFSIESTNQPEKEPIRNAYQIIQQLSGEIGKANPQNLEGVLLSLEQDSVTINHGYYVLTVTHPYNLSWAPKTNDWPLTGGIIIALPNDEFYVGGTGLVISFKSISGSQVGILKIDEGKFVNGIWQPERRMNGDQDHQGRHLRIDVNDYSIQRIKLYQYK
jgi:beta-galactosidase GanA